MNIRITTEAAPDGMVQWSLSAEREGLPTIMCQGRSWSEYEAVNDARLKLDKELTRERMRLFREGKR